MHPVLMKTFGGLSAQYYIRQFLFGLIFPAILLFAWSNGKPPHPMGFGLYAFFAVNSLLYPYARFVYEGIVDYIRGNNVFFVSAFWMLAVKFMTMTLCWAFAIFVAPVGLIYLYVHHSRQSAG